MNFNIFPATVLIVSSAAFAQETPDGLKYLEEVNRTKQSLETVVIDQTEFDDTSLFEALEFVSDAVRKEQQDFKSRLVDEIEDAPISLRITNTPANEVLRYVSILAEVKFWITGDGVDVVLPDAKAQPFTLAYKMDADWHKLTQQYANPNVAGFLLLESAKFDERTRIMTVTADYDGHGQFGSYLNGWRDDLPKVVRVSVDLISMKTRPAQQLLV
ncbi:MAG: hypothetical protein AAF585_01425 [Verrucomicrobiota bacterium]